MFHALHEYQATDLLTGERHGFWVGRDDDADDQALDFTDEQGQPTGLGFVDARDWWTRDAVAYAFGIEHEGLLMLRRVD